MQARRNSSPARHRKRRTSPTSVCAIAVVKSMKPGARKTANKSKIRARVEHVFAVVKRLWGFVKVRYRGLAKNATRAFTALALANIYMSRTRLMAQVRP
ncbi:transposase [Paraburkholderia sp. BL23I1N1]|uniref:transposase n=1 Tax=Paraburkholderia sp. BL23I1N1 TaxID=1938802 RepID=UPI0038F5DBFB